MKTKSTAFILFLFIVFAAQAQPEKGTWQIGGSGYRVKMKDSGEPVRNIYEYNAEGSYFILKNFSAGCELTYKGGKDTDSSVKNKYHGFFLSPTSELYLLREGKFTGSVKGLVKFNISGTGTFHKSKAIQSYMFGPKVSWFIADNVSFYSWVAFRKLMDDSSNFPGWTAVIPSENYDVRFGFNIFLQRKKK